MKGTPSSERIVASNGFSERQSGLPNPTRHAFVPVSTVEGPWAFALPLPPTGDIASASPSLPSAPPMDRHFFFNGAFYQ